MPPLDPAPSTPPVSTPLVVDDQPCVIDDDQPCVIDSAIRKARTVTGRGRRRRSAARLRRGTHIGQFEIRGELGRGGMGTVYEAHDRRLDRPVAIKILHPTTGRSEHTRLRREAEGLAKVSHPNVVQIYDVERVDDRLCIVMEHVAGQTLAQWQATPRPWSACLDAYRQAGRGLAAAHAKGLVHRDFKPSNCIIDPKGRVRVLDFGLVRDPEAERLASHDPDDSIEAPDHALSESLTRTGAMVGTPAYMSYEQLMGRPASPRSDQFSFCVSLYEALYGQRPFRWSNASELAVRLERGVPRSPPRRSAVPAPLWTILARGLSKEPSDRWSTMEQLLAALEAVERRRRWSPRRGWALAALAITMGAGLFAVLDADPPPPPGSGCDPSDGTMAGIWDDTTKAGLRQALEATDVPYASDTARRVGERLDAYAERWTQAHARACAPAEQGAPEPILRCLAAHRTRLRATIETLQTADAEVARRATEMVSELPDADRCEDPAYLQAQVPVPDDPALVVEVDAHRRELAQILALESAGRYDDALQRILAATGTIDALGFSPLRAEADLVHGLILTEVGRYDEAVELLHAAYFEAQRWDIGTIQAPAALELVRVLGSHQAEYAQARRWSQHALGLLERLGEPRLLIILRVHQGGLRTNEGKYDEALVALREGLAMHGAQGAFPDSLSAVLHYKLGVVLEIQGHHDDAAAEYRAAMEQYERALGPDHPLVAESIIGIGNVLVAQGRLEQGLDEYRRARSLWTRTLTPDHPELAHVHNNIGVVLAQLGRDEEALEEFRAALAIRIAALGPDHPDVAASHDNVGIALRALGQREEALREHRRALVIDSSVLEPGHPNIAFCHYNIGQVLLDEQRWEDAESELQKALEIWTKSLGPRHPRIAYVRFGLSTALRESGRPKLALDHAERVLSIRQEHAGESSDLAGARLLVARALWALGTQPSRARALAEQARDFWRGVKPPEPEPLAEVERALAEHG